MRVCRCIGILLLLAAAVVTTADAQQGGERPIFKAFDKVGSSFYQEMYTKTNQTMTVQGMKVEQTQEQTFFVKWTTKESKGDKFDVEYEIVGVKMDITIGGNLINYDSRDKSKAFQNPLTDFFGALVGSKFKLTINKDETKGVTVTDVDGLSTFVDRLSAANQQLQGLLKSILTKEAVQQMSNPTFAAFPPNEKDWAKGAWDYAVTLNMGPIGSYDTTYNYSVDSKDKTKINITGKMKYIPPDGKAAAGLPFIIRPKGTELKAESITGFVMIDPQLGRISDSKIEMNLKGNLVIDIAGMETTVDLNQKQTSTVKTMDEDRWTKK